MEKESADTLNDASQLIKEAKAKEEKVFVPLGAFLRRRGICRDGYLQGSSLDLGLAPAKLETLGGRLRGRLAANADPRGIPGETPWRLKFPVPPAYAPQHQAVTDMGWKANSTRSVSRSGPKLVTRTSSCQWHRPLSNHERRPAGLAEPGPWPGNPLQYQAALVRAQLEAKCSIGAPSS